MNHVLKFSQLSLWADCSNSCDFCYQRCYRVDCETKSELKRERILKAIDFVSELDAEWLGFTGGDIFSGQLRSCEAQWQELVEVLRTKDAKIFFTAHLIGEQYLLDETLNALDNDVMVCTSYDTRGRFHTREAERSWFANVEHLHRLGVQLNCTCIPTQDFLTTKVVLPDWLPVNLQEPIVSASWYASVDKANYHEHLIKDNHLFNLPLRRTAINWFRQHQETAWSYQNFLSTHADNIYEFNSENNIFLADKSYTTDPKLTNPKCHHPYSSQCYADSDKCMMCDAKRVVESFGD